MLQSNLAKIVLFRCAEELSDVSELLSLLKEPNP